MLVFWLSLLPIPVQIAIALTMYRRKQHTLYPWFWAFVLFECAHEIAVSVLGLWPRSRAYFFLYWGANFIDSILVLAVLREIFVKVLSGYSSVTRFRRRGYEFGLAVITLALVAVFGHLRGPSFYTRGIIEVQMVASLISLGMLVFVAIASVSLGIRWRSEMCGIASGLGILGLGDVLTFTRTLLHARYTPAFIGLVETCAYDITFLIFAAYFFIPQERFVTPQMRHELLDWPKSVSESIFK